MNLTEALKMIFHTNISDIKVENVISNPKLIISLLRDLTNNSDEIMAFNALINHYNFVEVFYYSENFELDYKLVYQELKVLFTKEIIEKKLNIVIKALQSTHIPKQINVTNKEVKLVNTEKEKKNIKQDEKILSEKEYFNKIIKRRTINSKLYEKYNESLNQVKILDFIKELNEELIDINKFIEYYPSNKGKLKIFIDNIYIEKHNLSKKFNSIQHSIKVTKNDNVKREVIKEKTKSKDASSNVRQEVIKPPQKGSTQVKRNVTPIHNVITPPPPPSGVKKNAVATSNINNEKTQFEAIKKERIKNAGTYRSRKNTKSLEIIEQIIQRRKIEISQIQEFLKRYNVSDNRRKTLENYIKISSDEKRIMEELKASLNKPASNSKKQVPVQKTVKPKNSLPALSRSAAYKKLNASIDKNLGSFISRVERDKSKLRYKIISYNYYSAFEYFLNSQNNRIKLQSVFNYVAHLEKNYKYVYWDHLNNRTFGLVQYVINNQSYFTDLKIK